MHFSISLAKARPNNVKHSSSWFHDDIVSCLLQHKEKTSTDGPPPEFVGHKNGVVNIDPVVGSGLGKTPDDDKVSYHIH